MRTRKRQAPAIPFMGRPPDLPAAALLPHCGGKCRTGRAAGPPHSCDATTQANGAFSRDNRFMNAGLGNGRWAEWLRASGKLSLQSTAGEGAAIACLIPMLLSIAIWNGFPIVFYDTGAYLLEGIGGHFLAERSPVYSLFLRAAGSGMSLWIVVIVHAGMTAFVIVETARSTKPIPSLPALLGISAALMVATGIGWYIGEIEPDCFAAVLVLALFVIAFRTGVLGRLRSTILIAVAGFAVAAHPSHLVLGVLLVSLLAAYRVVLAIAGVKTDVATGWPKVHLLKPAIAVAFAFVLVLAANFAFTGAIFLSRAGPNFLFARLLQDGVVERLLEDTCPRAGYRLCAYKDVLPPRADAWMWTPYSPFFKLGGFAGTRQESMRIVIDSLKRYPWLNVKLALIDGAEQFVSFRTGDQVEPQQWALRSAFAAFTPHQLTAYMSARQQRGQLHFKDVNLLHVPSGYLSLMGLTGLLGFAVYRREHDTALFAAFILAGLTLNALICGAISNPHDRYQSRLIWLAPFSVGLAVSGRRRLARGGHDPAG